MCQMLYSHSHRLSNLTLQEWCSHPGMLRLVTQVPPGQRRFQTAALVAPPVAVQAEVLLPCPFKDERNGSAAG